MAQAGEPDWGCNRIKQVPVAVRRILDVGIRSRQVCTIPALERVSAIDIEVEPPNAPCGVELDVVVGKCATARQAPSPVSKGIGAQRVRGKSFRPRGPDWRGIKILHDVPRAQKNRQDGGFGGAILGSKMNGGGRNRPSCGSQHAWPNSRTRDQGLQTQMPASTDRHLDDKRPG